MVRSLNPNGGVVTLSKYLSEFRQFIDFAGKKVVWVEKGDPENEQLKAQFNLVTFRKFKTFELLIPAAAR